MSEKFYTAFGYLTSAFAHLEADIRFLIAGVAFKDDSVTASAFLDRSQLGENLTLLKKIGRQYWDAEERLSEILSRIENIRQKRNLFIHGLWSSKEFGEKDGYAVVRDLRTTYEKKERSREWRHGVSHHFTISDFQEILNEVNQISKKIEELCEWFEKNEEMSFGYFGGTTMGRASTFAVGENGAIIPIEGQ